MEVIINYFKDTGKWYSEAQYQTDGNKHLFEIWAEIQEMMVKGKMPGLYPGECDFYLLVQVPAHPHNHLALLIPDKLKVQSKDFSNYFEDFTHDPHI